jgi:hypothetical protein
MIRSEFSENFLPLKSDQYVELFESSFISHKSYFNHPFFLFECLNSFSKVNSCFLFSVFYNNKLIGFDVFRRTKVKLRGVKVSFLVPGAYKIAEYNAPVVNSNFYMDYFKELFTVTQKISLFYHNCTGFYTEYFKKEVKGSFVYSITSNPVLKNIDDISKASSKKAGVRYLKVLKKENNVKVEHLKVIQEEDVLDPFFQLHIKRWSREGIKSKFIDNEFRQIYKSLFSLKIPEYGQPILSYIKSDDRFLSMHLGFIVGNSFLYQIPALDPDAKNNSAGTVLIKVILDFLVQEKLSVFDMGFGMEAYKFRYMNDVINYFSIVRFPNPIYQKLFKVKI